VPPARAVLPSPEPDSTPERLLDATERLVAAQGVDAVSLRAINAAAGSNVAAAHYHFGSKEALVAAVLRRRMGVLAEERLALLDPLRGLRRPPLRTIVEALVLPLARLAATDDGRHYVRFLAMLNHAGEPWWRLVAEGFAAQREPLEDVLARALPDVPADQRGFRLAVAGSLMLDVLAEPERHGVDAPGGLASRDLVPAIVDAMTAVLSGPPTTRRRPA
jgi:AcrR family transcriptional regulator